ncbi:MAG: riboflavin biosynthesis protein RibF [Phycisphaerae bacterium]|nr:riboflavin biosynthesis protein RibF [Phycisphaerae bacterium]
MPSRTVVTIGNFDGVHLGHAALLREARALAGPEGRVVALVFHPHPISVLRPDQAPATLTTFERRAELLRHLGATEVVRLDPTPELLNLTPDEFIQTVIARHNAAAFVEGQDFRFGRNRAGDVQTLARIAASKNLQISIINPIESTLADQTIVTASSTILRWLIAQGRVADAARVLGRPCEITGVVVRGDQRGRTIGFPTANIDTECLIPADAVYAGAAHLPDGRELPAAIHVGPRATFDNTTRTVEAYILDWRGPLEDGWPTPAGAQEYGWPIRLTFIAHLRDQAKFEGIRPLVDQINRDVERTRALTTAAPRGYRRETVNA